MIGMRIASGGDPPLVNSRVVYKNYYAGYPGLYCLNPHKRTARHEIGNRDR
jgi:hypothetical protein